MRKGCARRWRSKGKREKKERNKICETCKRRSEKPSSNKKLFLDRGRVEQNALVLQQLISGQSMTSQALALVRAKPS